MKKIEFFGFVFNFEFERKNLDDPDTYSKENILKQKIFYLIIIMSLVAMSSTVSLLYKNENYKVGDVIKNDLYSPKNIVFKDEMAKNKIIEQIIEGAGKEYIYVAGAEQHSLDSIDYFINNIIFAKNKKIVYDSKIIERETGVKISENLVEDAKKMSLSELQSVRKNAKDILLKLYEKGIFKEEDGIKLDKDIEEKSKELGRYTQEIIKIFASPNYIYDKEKTRLKVREKALQIKDQLVKIKTGDLIVKKGEILSENKVKLLESVGIYSIKKNIVLIIISLAYLAIISVVFYLISFNILKKEILNKNIYRSTILLISILFLFYRFLFQNYLNLLPFDAVLYIFLILSNIQYSFIMGIFMLAYLLPMTGFNTVFFVINVFTVILASQLVKKIRTRSEVINMGIKISIVKVMIFMILSIYVADEISVWGLKGLEILISGIASGMITLAAIPYFEKTFNLLNIFKLLELGDLSNPLLKQFSIAAPGSFQHSMMVATMSENAAESINANSIFCRVASYYHDIGKMKRPNFYVENQNGIQNPHEKLSPFLSTMIIKKHTRDGVEIGKKYKIPKEIRNIMLEHQGTTLLAYFYNKAKSIDSSIKIEDFRYSGPRPKSKESAIIMLADSLEAAARALDEKTPVSIEVMVRKIIMLKIEEEQLIEADLTFREIEVIIKSFTKTLISIHHVRIKYPNQK